MTTPSTTPAPASSASIGRALLADRHFLVAAAVLAVTWAGWGPAMHWLDIHTLKSRCPWPPLVQVSEDYRWTSLPLAFGPMLPDGLERFKKVDPSDRVPGKGGNAIDGENIIPAYDLESLGIGGDPKDLSQRRSNWYVSRYYLDRLPQAPVRMWRLDVFYYTGGRDTVPHVPEICMGAGGLKNVVGDRFEAHLPLLPDPWDKTVPLQRTRATDEAGRALVEYYTFSMNGTFETDRLMVRGRLINPFVRYAYFAKIQFSPLGGSADFDQMDRAAEEFLQYAFPEVLKALPSSRDVKALEQAGP